LCPPFRDQQWGTALDDEALALAASGDTMLVAGHRGGRLDESDIGPTGDAHGFVRALRPTGEVAWETVLATAGTDAAEALAFAADGTIAVAGRTTGAFPGATNAGQFDAFVARLEPSGLLRDVRQWGDERPQHPRRVLFHGGDLYVGGYEDLFIPSNFVQDVENPFFAQLGATAATPSIWLTSRTRFPDRVDGLAAEPDGSAFYLAGSNQGGPQPGVFVLKFDANGNQVFGARLSPTGFDTAGGLLLSASGELLLASTRVDGGTGTSDPVLQSLDRATLAPLWTRRYLTTSAAEFVTGLAADGTGNLYLGGWIQGDLDPSRPGKGGIDFFALKVDAQGAPLASWQGGTAGNDFATALAVDSCGRVLVAGSTDGTLPGSTSAGRRDALLMRAFAE
jgi:hypothetical protein